jgi:hypothetical protein
MLEASRAAGMAALAAGEPERAVRTLRAVWEHMLSQGVADPGAFPVAPDLVEALAQVGAMQEARAVAGRLREQAEAQEHPWGLASATRCTAVIRLASSYDEAAVGDLAAAAAGTYGYQDVTNGSAGTVSVTPTSGSTSTTFTITWAAATLNITNYVFDVQIKRPGSSSFADWKTGVSTLKASFTPDSGTGTYSFRARVRNALTSDAIAYSAAKSISVR